MIQIKNRDTGNVFTTTGTGSLAEMQQACPRFFEPFGNVKRETYAVHRGQLIIRHTTTCPLTREKVRRTVVYLFGAYEDGAYADADLFCVSSGNSVNSVREAEKLIDRILDGGEYAYCLDAPVLEKKV